MVEGANRGLSAFTWGWVCVGGALRLARLPLRWGPVTWDYGAYHQGLLDALRAGDLTGALRFTGWHPPLHGLALSALDLLSPRPLVWLAFSWAASTAAIALTAVAARRLGGDGAAPVAAAFLATSPIALAYSVEVLSYPLLSLSLAGLMAALAAQRGLATTALWGAAAAWTHMLGLAGAAAAMIVAPSEARQRALRILGLSALCLPLLFAVWGLADQPMVPQPQRPWAMRASLFHARFGPMVWASAALVIAALPGLRRTPTSALIPLGLASGMAVMLAVSLGAGVAATHQFQYLSAFSPAVALMVGLGLGHGRWRSLALLTAGALALAAAAQAGQHLSALSQDLRRDRALDQALRASHPGDTLWLISPYHPDDDKKHVEPMLWRLPPWQKMPAARPFPADYGDHRYGAPRIADGRVTSLFHKGFPRHMGEAVAHMGQGGGTLFVVTWGLKEQPELAAGPLDVLRGLGLSPTALPGAPEGEGLWRVRIPAAGAP